jgi:hypothetical protein
MSRGASFVSHTWLFITSHTDTEKHHRPETHGADTSYALSSSFAPLFQGTPLTPGKQFDGIRSASRATNRRYLGVPEVPNPEWPPRGEQKK